LRSGASNDAFGAHELVAGPLREPRELRPEVAGLRVLRAFGGFGGHPRLVERVSAFADALGDAREIEPRPREYRIVGDDLLELVARGDVGALIEQELRESPARTGRRGVALELRAQLLLADGRQQLAVFVEQVVGVLAVAVVHQRERVELAGEPAIEPRAVDDVVLDRFVGAPDPAFRIDRDRIAVERRESKPRAVEIDFDIAGRRDLERVDEQPGTTTARVQLDQRLGRTFGELAGLVEIVQPELRRLDRGEDAVEIAAVAPTSHVTSS
jgi:hypothetical protein